MTTQRRSDDFSEGEKVLVKNLMQGSRGRMHTLEVELAHFHIR